MKQNDSRERLRWCLRAAFALVPLGAVLGAALTESACLPTGRPCSPGDNIPCNCSNGLAGAQLCADDGSSYGACDCTVRDSGLAPDTGPVADGSADASETGAHDAAAPVDAGACSAATGRPIFCPCTTAAQCADGICHSYNTKGQLCTKACKTANDCPMPQSKSCSGMAFVCAPA